MTADIVLAFICRLTRFILVSWVGVFAGCSVTNKEAQLSPLERAEHRLVRAERMRSDPQQETAEFLSVARTAADEISRASDLSAAESVRIYNRAAADLAAELPELSKGYNRSQYLTAQDRLTGEIFRIQTRPSEGGEYPFTYFQEILDARTLKPRRGEPVVAVSGVGGTVVGVHRSAAPGSPLARFEPTNGYRVPVTSVVDFSRSSNAAPIDARLRLISPLRRDSVEIENKRFPLAANFSAPILAFGRVNELWLGFINMIRSTNTRSRFGLLFAEPYDPDRIPVIFVHGVLSSTFIWRRTVLNLLQDPEIRRHYQFWAFSYPTGNPVSYSALRLREDLAFAQKQFGLTQGVILIGHSMGGILSRMQVTNSGRTIWDAVFGRSAQELYQQLPEDSRAKRALIFEANPAVTRVIFVATPHRGSSLAAGGIAAIAIWLIRLPAYLLYDFPETVVGALDPASLGTRQQGGIIPTSIQGLSPNSALLRALDRLPIQAPHYSIIGDRGRGNTPNSSDGVVPYWSSHLASAESEKIVPTGHEPMADPAAVAEIRRILLLNLGMREKRPSAVGALFYWGKLHSGGEDVAGSVCKFENSGIGWERKMRARGELGDPMIHAPGH
jgi:pimeloyl-ACP methyl ester carboxylesterase